MAAPAPQYGNYVLGKGRVFVAKYLPDGSYGPLRYVGTSTAFNVNVTVETYEYYTGDCGPNEKVIDIATQTNRTVSLTLDDMTWENMALALGGDVSTVSRTAQTAIEETFEAVKVGYHYPLGVTSAAPLGLFGAVASVVVEDDATPTPATLVEGTDYIVNYKRGVIHILPGGAISDGDDISVTYNVVAEESVRIESTPSVGEQVKIVFEACNESGENRDAVIPLTSLKPAADIAFRGTEAQTLTFEGAILKHPTLPSIIIDGKAAA